MQLKGFFGTKDFYKKVIMLTLPIMIQNGITQFVNMLDNLMVGRVGTPEMSGVSISNQLIFVFNLCVFGALSGAGIFGAQFFGNGNTEGVRNTFRFKLVFSVIISVFGIVFFYFLADPLISAFLTGEGKPEEIEATFRFGKEYLMIMLIGFLPFTLSQSFASTLRETGKAISPMVTSVMAVAVNLVFNYILIFGHFGAPKLGVAGAAIATVISRYVELIAIVFWSVKTRAKNQFMIGAFKSLKIPMELVKSIIKKGMPLMLSETLWSGGMAMLNQCFSVRDYAVVPATNISSTFFNLFSVTIIALSSAIGILMGQQLGAGETKTAMANAKKLIVFATIVGFFVGIIFAIAAIWIPYLYETGENVRSLATIFMQILAIILPFDAAVTASYFIMRSGGKTLITLLFDSGSMWCISVLLAFVISRFTDIPIVPFFAIVQFAYVIKAFIGIFIVKKGKWIENIVAT